MDRHARRGVTERLTPFTVAAGLLVVLTSCGGQASSRLVSDSRPLDAPLVDEPSVTTTSVPPTLPPLENHVTTPASIAISQRPVQPLRLEGSDETLRVVAELDNATPLAGQVVRLRLTIVDRPSIETINVRFGDRWGGVVGPPAVDCFEAAKSSTTSSPPKGEESSKTYHHAYRTPGEYRLWIDVRMSGCDHAHHVELNGTVVVGPGVTRSNGPLLPTVRVSRSTPADAPGSVELKINVRDQDGFIFDVTVKWGDGTDESKRYQLTDCLDDEEYWRPTSDYFRLRHTYPSKGRFQAVVTVSSSGCGGADVQTRTTTATVGVS